MEVLSWRWRGFRRQALRDLRKGLGWDSSRRREHGTTDRLALPHQHRLKGEIAEKPSAGDPKPAAGDPKPFAGDPKPDAGDPKPAAGDPKPAAGDPKHAVRATRNAGRRMRSLLLDGASRLFKEKGLAGTSIS